MIYVDLDGVLADFPLAVGIRLGKIPTHNGTGLWMEEACGGKTGLRHLWDSLKEDSMFWERIPVFHDAAMILATCREFSNELGILTSARNSGEICKGKLRWIEKHFPFMLDSTAICTNKSQMRREILVDDWEKHVDAFGSNGVLVPRPWNRDHALPLLSTIHSRLARICQTHK